jgi:hypothetical protein
MKEVKYMDILNQENGEDFSEKYGLQKLFICKFIPLKDGFLKNTGYFFCSATEKSLQNTPNVI